MKLFKNLSERDRKLLTIVGSGIGVVLLWFVVISPIWDSGVNINKALESAINRKNDADKLEKDQVKLNGIWHRMKSHGEIGVDPYETSNQVVDALQKWAHESGLSVPGVQAEPPASAAVDARADKPESKFRKITIHVTADGPMAGMANFLWRVEAVPMVLRIVDINLSPKKEATDDLQLQLTVATLCPTTDPMGAAKRTTAFRAAAGPRIASADISGEVTP